MECSEVREHLPAFDEEVLSPDVLSHLAACEQCRSILKLYRELDAGLACLATLDIEPPAWLLEALTEAVAQRLRRKAVVMATSRQLSRATTRQIGEHRLAAGGALLLAGVALLVKGRSRRRVRPAGAKIAA